MFKFERLDVWKKSIDLYTEVSELSNRVDQQDQFSLGEQMRRAALSVSTNIAEATGREREKEARFFFNISKGSVYEVVSLLHVARGKGYVSAAEFDLLYQRCDEIARMLSGLLVR